MVLSVTSVRATSRDFFGIILPALSSDASSRREMLDAFNALTKLGLTTQDILK